MVKEAVIYCRVSTNLQIGDNHVTMELQEKRGHEFAARTGYTVIKTCSDAGISGKSRKNRKGLNEALSLLKKDDALIVFNLSRLARNTRETLEIFEEIQKKKAHLLSVTENINSADAVGRLWITLLSSLAQFERETTAERVSKAMEYKKQKGERVGRIPFGYQLSNGKGSLLVENPEEQRIIRLIFDKRATLDDKGKPKSYRKIADELNNENVPAGKTAKQWYPTSCERILKRKPIVIVPQVEEQDLEPNEDDIHRLLASTLADFEQNDDNQEEDNQEEDNQDENEEDQEDYEDYQNEDDDNQDQETEDRYENGDIEEDPEPEDNNQDEGQEDQNQGENQEEIDDPPANEDNQAHENEDDNQDENQDETNNQAQTFDLTQTISLLQRAINEKWPQEQIDAIRSLLTPALGLTPQTQTQKVTKPNIRKVEKSPVTPTITPTAPKAKISKAVAKNNPVPEASPVPKALPNSVPKSIPKPASTQAVAKGTQPLKKPAQKASPVPNAIPKSIPKTAEGKPLIENKGPVKNTRPPVPKEVPKSIARAPTMAQPIVQKNSMSKVETKPTIGNRDTQNVPKRIPR